MEKPSCKLFVCTEGKKCPKRGSKQIFRKLREVVKEQGLESSITVKSTDCLKLCKFGPAIIANPGKVTYGHVTEDDCRKIVDATAKGDQVDTLVIKGKGKGKDKRKRKSKK